MTLLTNGERFGLYRSLSDLLVLASDYGVLDEAREPLHEFVALFHDHLDVDTQIGFDKLIGVARKGDV